MVDLKKEKEPGQGMERVRLPDDLTTVEAPERSKENLEVMSWIEKIEKKFARVPNDTIQSHLYHHTRQGSSIQRHQSNH